MHSLTSLIRSDREFSGVLATVKEQFSTPKPLPVIVNGLCDGAAAAFLAESIRETKVLSGCPALVLVGDEEEREKLVSVLTESGISALSFPDRDFVFHNVTASHDTERERLSVLFAVTAGSTDCVVATGAAALSYTMPEERLLSASLMLGVGDSVPPDDLCRKFDALGFVRVDMVESAGQYARRGGIVDLYPDAGTEPVRIEFFGDEVDRMGYFDPISQRMTGECEEVRLLPATEVVADDEAKKRIADAIGKLLKKNPASAVAERLSAEKAAIENGLPLDFRDKYIGLIYEKGQTLLSYFDSYRRAAVYVCGTSGVRESVKKQYDRLSEEVAAMTEQGSLPQQTAGYAGNCEELDAFLARNLPLHVNPFSGGLGSVTAAGLFGFRTRRTVSYGDNGKMLKEDLLSLRKGLYRTVVLCENRAGAVSLTDSLTADEVPVIPVYDKPDFDFSAMQNGGIYIAVGDVIQGYELISPRVAVLSMKRDTGRAVMRNRRRNRILKKAGGAGQRLLSYADLSIGDYVVHENYGIGLFEGIETVKVDGVSRDYITIRYAGTDKLFLPCDRLELIGKYIGAKDKDGTVKLSKMGGGDWNKTKSRTKAAVKNIAKDLIALYAERQRRPGYAFPPDSEMEDEFADNFEFEETESQSAAIDEIKKDMMKPVPMNRLLCGDVGFGKTEVALRAAFKAVLGGKQVAILVPTTILALQHFQTTVSRMRGYAVNVEMLSRFRTPKEQATILRKVARGDVDILIGTHKLLSKNLEFRDLGLLIVDEEQRFGVAQKEKLKTLAKNVDVLTLTATPIPRTLNMAMNGISDMSVLEEAPLDRKPVQTYVLEHDDAVIREAIRRELDRGGQVLYLYNKTEDIDLVAGRLMNAFPEARITYAHGQMDKDELEDIWQGLVGGEIDILVCTTIVETGVDLPNANTLIIENADRMGLSQLHQLRGRVGRSARQAYAYFTFRKGKALSEVATKRLEAIREYAEFGAGFKIALRDLEIRGAGNLLGAEQHGYIDGVGYDLYVRLLSEAVLEEEGKLPRAPFECTVDIKVSAHIPKEYIPTDAQRMEMYKKISYIRGEEDKQDVIDEFLDRFGEIPASVLALADVSLLRALGAKARVSRISEKDGWLSLRTEKPDLALWSEVFVHHPGLSFRQTDTPTLVMRLPRGTDPIREALSILSDYPTVTEDGETAERNKPQ